MKYILIGIIVFLLTCIALVAIGSLGAILIPILLILLPFYIIGVGAVLIYKLFKKD